jgi:predicted DNA-binding ribbon-helix-helix protein
MCWIFKDQPAERYRSMTRSIRIDGHATSIRLEAAFWAILEEVAAKERVTIGKFMTSLYVEVLRVHGDAGNFASLLRCACLNYVEDARTTAPHENALPGVMHGETPKRVAARSDSRAYGAKPTLVF